MSSARVRPLRRQMLFALAASLLIQIAVVDLSKAQSLGTNEFSAPSPSKIIDPLLSDDSPPQEALLSSEDFKPASREPNGYISGTVLDQTGAISIGAEVRLSCERQSSTQKMQSGNNGQFLFTNVVPGPFHLTVTVPGFATREFSAELQPGETFLVPPIKLSIVIALTEVHVQDSPLTTIQLADRQITEQTKQRVLGIFPNFYVSYDPDAVPLNPQQKFRLARKTILDPMTLVGVGALAGVEQATNAFDGYGQGAQGYFKRFAASYTDAITSTYIGSAILPSVLKQDPRYFYKGTGSKKSRLLYALASPFICKGDNMRWQPNYSNVGGAFASGAISYLYYPESHQRADIVLQTTLIRLGEMSFEGLLQEFLIRRLTPGLRKRASDQR